MSLPPLAHELHDNYWLMPLVFAGLAALRLIALSSKARASGGNIEFSGTLPHRLLILFGSSGAFAVLITTWRTSHMWEHIALLLIAIGIAAGWPPSVRIDDHAISEKWWWKGRVSITWSEVSSVEENGGGEYQVYGEEGRSIRFSRYLVDSQRFREEIRRRAKPKVRLAIDPISVTKG